MLKSPEMRNRTKIIPVLITLSAFLLTGCNYKENNKLIKGNTEVLTTTDNQASDNTLPTVASDSATTEEAMPRIATTSAKQKITKTYTAQTKSIIDIVIVASDIRISSDSTKFIIEGTLRANVSNVSDLDTVSVLITYYDSNGILVRSFRNKPILAPGDPKTGITFKVLSEVVQNADSYRLQISY